MQEAKRILLLGAGGHCLSIIDTIMSSYNYDQIGIIEKVDNKVREEDRNMIGIPIVGNDNDLERLYLEGYTDAFVALGSIGDVTVRKKLYRLAKKIGYHIPNIIDKSSTVSKYVNLGEGIYIGKNSVVNACVTIGNLAIINTSSVIEHECRIQDYVHIASGSILCGNVQVGSESHIGAGSVIKQGVNIGSNTMIGMGSVVVKNCNDNITAYGNPCIEVNHE